jgi:hypothetical protein
MVFYYDEDRVRQLSIENKVASPETSYKMPRAYFDPFMVEYLLGALPLKAGYTCSFDIYKSDVKKEGTQAITKVIPDAILSDNGSIIPVYVAILSVGAGIEGTYNIRQSDGALLKAVYALPDGSLFIKSKI